MSLFTALISWTGLAKKRLIHLHCKIIIAGSYETLAAAAWFTPLDSPPSAGDLSTSAADLETSDPIDSALVGGRLTFRLFVGSFCSVWELE